VHLLPPTGANHPFPEQDLFCPTVLCFVKEKNMKDKKKK
jgi:hypothetical protein